MGAWIETLRSLCSVSPEEVAPLVGAWIETGATATAPPAPESRTPRGCVD